jgi:catechol 2,3-dioxygenase-like lactoylglutathione lyase family enzyme
MNNNNWAEYGIHSINHFALEVPDLAIQHSFLEKFGVRVTEASDSLEVRAQDHDHVWVRIGKGFGTGKKLAYVSLGCYREDFDGLIEQVLDAGGKEAQPHTLGSHDGFWFTDPHGLLLQIRVAGKTMPDSKSRMKDMNAPEGVQATTSRSAMRRVHPTRLSHMLLFTPDVNRSIEFFERGLGVKTADRSGDLVAFTYARFGCDHHLLALVASDGVGLHHSSWDLPAVDELGLGAEFMRDQGYKRQWGLGRHVLGSNFFNYICDDFGAWWEYNCHIDYVPAGMTWDGGDFPAEDSFYLWGPEVPEGFADNNES